MEQTFIMINPDGVQRGLGKNLVTTARKIIGATNPADSAPGTIRGHYAILILGGMLFMGVMRLRAHEEGDCSVVPRRNSRMEQQPSPVDL